MHEKCALFLMKSAIITYMQCFNYIITVTINCDDTIIKLGSHAAVSSKIFMTLQYTYYSNN